MPKISIIVSIYNMAEYLDDTIGCLIQQTLSDIEIICVDDGSTDASYEITKQYADKDCRIIAHRFSENKSSWEARNWGIRHASGKYIMFLDADDSLKSNACKELYAEMERHPVDILHFGTNVVNVNGLPEYRIAQAIDGLLPYPGELYGEDVFRACFIRGLYQFTLWNKIYKAEVCKRAISDVKSAYLPRAQDKYLYMIIALSSQSYRGLPDRVYYNYYYGRGGEGHYKINLKQFERFCAMSDTAAAMHEYLVRKGFAEKYKDFDKRNYADLFGFCFYFYNYELDDQYKAKGLMLMFKKWRRIKIIKALIAEGKDTPLFIRRIYMMLKKIRYNRFAYILRHVTSKQCDK